MRFEINLASQPYQNVQRFLVRWGIAVGVVALLVAGLVYAAVADLVSWRVTQKQIHILQRQIGEFDRQQAKAEAFLDLPENRETRNRSEFLNFLIARKAFSWTEVFTDLEQIMPPRLRLQAMHPKVNDDGQLELHLTVVGPERDAAIELVRRLEQSPHFARAQIISEAMESPGQPQGPADGVHYEISAIYIPAFARGQQQTGPADSGSPSRAGFENDGVETRAGSGGPVNPGEASHGRP